MKFINCVEEYYMEKSYYRKRRLDSTNHLILFQVIHFVISYGAYILVHKTRIIKNLGVEGRFLLKNLRSILLFAQSAMQFREFRQRGTG